MSGIKNSESLEIPFGGWPSFRDAEVLFVALDREGHDGYQGPTIETKIHVFDITGEVDSQGFLVLLNHTLVTLRFFNVEDFLAESFNHQNVVFGLEIHEIPDRQLEHRKFDVQFRSSFGLEMKFACEAVEVAQVEPYELHE